MLRSGVDRRGLNFPRYVANSKIPCLTRSTPFYLYLASSNMHGLLIFFLHLWEENKNGIRERYTDRSPATVRSPGSSSVIPLYAVTGAMTYTVPYARASPDRYRSRRSPATILDHSFPLPHPASSRVHQRSTCLYSHVHMMMVSALVFSKIAVCLPPPF